jgi:hypothetical protein
MTMPLAISLFAWVGLLPGLVVALRLRRAATADPAVKAPPAPVGNSAHLHQRGRLRRVPYQATHVDSRRARYRIGHASGGCGERH